MKSIVVVALLLLAGCSPGTPIPTPTITVEYVGEAGYAYTFYVTAIDGRRIPCISITGGGLTCDWMAK